MTETENTSSKPIKDEGENVQDDDDSKEEQELVGRAKEEAEYERQKNEKTCGCCPRVIAGECRRFDDNGHNKCCKRCVVEYYINPVVMSFAILIIWGFVIYTAVDYENAADTYGKAQAWIVKNFTWLYVGTLSLFMVFCFYLIFSKYGDIKLGPKDEPPPYTRAGVGVGLYYFGVAEPVFYIGELQSGASRWYDNQINKQGMDAINLAWFHWGLSASASYVVAGLPLAYHHHSQGEPMRESVCFMELLGKKYVNAAIGNIIDLCSVIGTMFGIGTSLGLGAMQINAGLNFTFGIKEAFSTQMVIIWGITILATISVLSGVDKGIKLLSQAFVGISFLFLVFIFFSGDTMFFLNLFIQGIGYHLTWLLELQFSTQAFEQAGFYDQNDAGSGLSSVNKQSGWMGGWTIFYWAWWIAWAPFVGIFLANISRGRTVREFVIGNMLVPTILTCIWFAIIGGWGLYNEMAAIQLGMSCNTDAQIANGAEKSNFGFWNDIKIIKLSCYGTSHMLFAALTTLPFKEVTSIIIMISIVLGFVTSSDSASMVIDILTASGNEFPPKIQRLFWALSEGAVASALLGSVKDGSALGALQTASLVGALPLTIILLFELLATLKSFKKHFGEIDEKSLKYWKKDIFEAMFVGPSFIENVGWIIIAILCPPIIQTQTILKHQNKIKEGGNGCSICNIIVQWLLYLATVTLWICGMAIKENQKAQGLTNIGWTLYVAYIFRSIDLRRTYKKYSNVTSSNLLYDLLAWIFWWFGACLQERCEFENYDVAIAAKSESDGVALEMADKQYED